ncbi:zinc finger protein 135-like [Pecten maximus]|uniref:zinc finger protein 135-like n=1 Tax=Pecten maximus TaxID=6579 RepID=UPI0014591B48|nr:zinc finger protein 135-like [Pecten maximus]
MSPPYPETSFRPIIHVGPSGDAPFLVSEALMFFKLWTAIDQSATPAKKGKFSCPHCDKSFEHKKSLTRHVAQHGDIKWKCGVCNKEFARKDRLTRHEKVHGKPLHLRCGKSFWRADKYREHLKAHNKSQHGGALEIAEHENKENAQPPKDQQFKRNTDRVNAEMENNSANRPYRLELLTDIDQHITYLDANNLYGWAMSQYLPTHGFAWLTDNEKDMLDITTVTDDATRGYTLEVNLEYHTELHDLHNDYPLAPKG